MELGVIRQLTENPSIIVNPENKDNKEILSLLREIDKKLAFICDQLAPKVIDIETRDIKPDLETVKKILY